MILSEQWIQWKPINNLSPKYYIKSISDDIEGLKILLSDVKNEKQIVKIMFDDSTHSYRSTDESFRLSTINSLDKKYGTKFYSEWTFFKVDNSKYISWLSEQSYEIAESENLMHFSLIAVDSIVDVIAAYEPSVELI